MEADIRQTDIELYLMHKCRALAEPHGYVLDTVYSFNVSPHAIFEPNLMVARMIAMFRKRRAATLERRMAAFATLDNGEVAKELICWVGVGDPPVVYDPDPGPLYWVAKLVRECDAK